MIELKARPFSYTTLLPHDNILPLVSPARIFYRPTNRTGPCCSTKLITEIVFASDRISDACIKIKTAVFIYLFYFFIHKNRTFRGKNKKRTLRNHVPNHRRNMPQRLNYVYNIFEPSRHCFRNFSTSGEPEREHRGIFYFIFFFGFRLITRPSTSRPQLRDAHAKTEMNVRVNRVNSSIVLIAFCDNRIIQPLLAIFTRVRIPHNFKLLISVIESFRPRRFRRYFVPCCTK